MKKEKKSPRSKVLEHRHHKTSKSRHRKESGLRERHAKHYRSRSPSFLKRKNVDAKEQESPKSTPEVSTRDSVHNTAAKTELFHADQAKQDCTSLENFVNDKEQMIQELFEAICEDNLKKITPDSLKNCPLEELKAMCLEELIRMTSAEISYILSGKDPSLFEPSVNIEEAKEQNVLVPVEEDKGQSEPGSKGDAADTLSTSSSERLKELTSSKRVSAADEQESTPSVTGDTKSEAESDSLELCATQKEIDSLIQEEILNQTGSQDLAQQSKTDLSDMEILELELRARIIRSLLRSHGMDISDEEEGTQQKENFVIKEENT